MNGSKWLAAAFLCGIAGFWCSCERHDWQDSTNALYRPHHAPADHSGGAGVHSRNVAPEEKHGVPGEAKGQTQSEKTHAKEAGQEGGAGRRIFPQ